MPDFETYLSPFTWRYGSQAMRHIWSEAYNRRLWRRIWVALASVEAEFGLVTAEQLADLRQHQDDIDLPAALALEAEIHHDLMAELKLYASQCLLGGGILHLGATSMDVKDNADALRLRESLDLLLASLAQVLQIIGQQIDRWADTPLIAFTHLQPAEPSTLGYRLALYGQDLLGDYQDLKRLRDDLRGKGIRGAVGTGASFVELIGDQNLAAFERRFAQELELPFYPVVSQTYPRKQDYRLLTGLAGLGASIYKFAFDLRLLANPTVGELAEPFGRQQVGSSAMPFKRNPIQAEKMNSLARQLAGLPRLAWDNAAHSLLERTLDDSANRRSLLPQAFLICDELLKVAGRTLEGLQVNERALAANLAAYGPFAATERLLVALVKAGADRQAMHEQLRQHSLAAWQALQAGEANPLQGLLRQDAALQAYLPAEEIDQLMDAGEYLGDAPQRARALAGRITETVSS